MAYNGFAYYYDSLMDETLYTSYKRFILQYAPDSHHILELGCGTGTTAIELAKEGKRIYATDLSEEMLDIAAYKAEKEGVEIAFDCVNMTNFRIQEQFDTVLCLIDSINYLNSKEDTQLVINNAYNALKAGGTFIFDVHSMHKVNVTFLDYHEHEESDDYYFDWHVYKTGEGKIEHHVVIKENGEEDVEEYHEQTTYPVETYLTYLKDAGFSRIRYYSDFHDYCIEDDRVIFVAVK